MECKSQLFGNLRFFKPAIPVPSHLIVRQDKDRVNQTIPSGTSVFTHTDIRQTVPQRFPKSFYENRKEMTANISIYERRKEMLTNVCRRHKSRFASPQLNRLESHISFDKDHKIIYCKIQKVATTFMTKMMVKLRERDSVTKYKKQTLGKLSFDGDIQQLYNTIQTSFKFLFVRDPYARAVSGYIDKLYAPNPLYWSIVGKFSVQTFRKNATKISKRCGHNLSFPEFVRYLIHSQKTGERKDRHFYPMYEHCAPCLMKYDFVGKLETFKNDTLFLFNRWNSKFGTNISFADFEKESDMRIATSQVNRLYNFRPKIERCMTFYQGMCRVWHLLQARGIIPKSVDIPISREKSSNMSKIEFQKVIYQAIESVTDRKAVKDQREQVLVAAYNLVPKKDLEALAEIFRPDCELFGYDPLPSEIFSNLSNTFSKQFPFLDIT